MCYTRCNKWNNVLPFKYYSEISNWFELRCSLPSMSVEICVVINMPESTVQLHAVEL
jgi:hypothetical protein